MWRIWREFEVCPCAQKGNSVLGSLRRRKKIWNVCVMVEWEDEVGISWDYPIWAIFA